MSVDIVVGKVVGMLINHNKAFDAIPPEIKMNKVKCYGIRGVESECVRSYLKNRKVCKDGKIPIIMSGYCPSRVSTWSMLFILHINDIFKTSHLIKFTFANDTNIMECDEKCKKNLTSHQTLDK